MCGCTVDMAYVTNICGCNLNVQNVMLVKIIKIHDFKLSPCFESIMYSFGCFPGV